VVGWDGPALRGTRTGRLGHAAMISSSERMAGRICKVPMPIRTFEPNLRQGPLRLAASANVTLTLRATAPDQYVLRLHGGAGPVVLEAALPRSSTPRQVNVWRGARVWHVANSSAGSSAVRFEALPGLDYMIEGLCFWNVSAGYGPTQASRRPPRTGGRPRVGATVGGWLCDVGHD
jgi:hypothetical protein